MIIYGSRMYGRRNTVKGWGDCANCGNYAKHTSYSGRKWGHLYFIPLIPEGPRVRVVKECKKCSHGMHFPEQDVPTILNDLRQNTKHALAALIAGDERFDNNGAMTPAVPWLVGSVDLLLCLQADDHLRLVLSALQAKHLTHAYHLVNGALQEFQGKLDEAAEAYRLAAGHAPADPLAFMAIGSIHMKKKDQQGARAAYEKALERSDDRVPVLQVLLRIYAAIKDYSLLADTYAECFTLVPELRHDKKVFKAYKKACKKSGKQPV